MTKSQIRDLKKKRDEARRRAENLERFAAWVEAHRDELLTLGQAEGKNPFVREWLLHDAKRHRDDERACNMLLGRHA